MKLHIWGLSLCKDSVLLCVLSFCELPIDFEVSRCCRWVREDWFIFDNLLHICEFLWHHLYNFRNSTNASHILSASSKIYYISYHIRSDTLQDVRYMKLGVVYNSRQINHSQSPLKHKVEHVTGSSLQDPVEPCRAPQGPQCRQQFQDNGPMDLPTQQPIWYFIASKDLTDRPTDARLFLVAN